MCAKAITIGDARVDELSQKILVTLDDADGPKTVADLKDELGEQRQKIWYRLNEHLAKADLVRQVNGPNRRMHGDGPFWSLSVSGKMFVADNRTELARPKSLKSVSTEVLEAVQEAESAKTSVQKYRKKLYELKQEQKETEKVLDYLTGKNHVTRKDMVRFFDRKMSDTQQSVNAQADRLDARLDMLNADLNEVEERLNVLSDYISATSARAKTNEQTVEKHDAELDKAWQLYKEIEGKVGELEDEKQSWFLS